MGTNATVKGVYGEPKRAFGDKDNGKKGELSTFSTELSTKEEKLSTKFCER